MVAQYMPKTLAKTLSYIAYHAPHEAGLFWNPDGTMPWKELYWALQEDPELRFVRESHLRELAYLNIELPFALEGNLLRLRSDLPSPSYPGVEQPPERLYHACRRKQYLSIAEYGLRPSQRLFLPLTVSREMALRLARRRDPDPIVLEVLAAKASAGGIPIRQAGPELYLVESVPVEYLRFPTLREDELLKLSTPPKKDKKPAPAETQPTPGSFFMDFNHFQGQSPSKGTGGKAARKGGRGADWKREARKDRHKRNV